MGERSAALIAVLGIGRFRRIDWQTKQGVDDIVVEGNQFLRAGQEINTLRRQLRAAALAALEEAMADQRFEPPYLLRDRGLRAPDPLSRPRKTSSLCDQHEAAQQVDVEGRSRAHGSSYSLMGHKHNSFPFSLKQPQSIEGTPAPVARVMAITQMWPTCIRDYSSTSKGFWTPGLRKSAGKRIASTGLWMTPGIFHWI